ncbi:MAG: pilus assembly protein CpaF [Bermanella sp.]|jgi:pilus assembly protein CpaF
MFKVLVTHNSGKELASVVCAARSCQLGKSRDNIIRLQGWRVAPLHVRIEKTDVGLFVEDISRGFKLLVNGEEVKRHGPIEAEDEIQIASYKVYVSLDDGKKNAEAAESPPPILDKAVEAGAGEAGAGEVQPVGSEYMKWSKYIHGELFRVMDLRRLDLDSMDHDEVREHLAQLVDEIVEGVISRIPTSVDIERLKKIVLDEAVGLGPLEEFLADPEVTEIMVNSHDEIYVERKGRLSKSGVSFSSPEAVLSTIDRIISPLGRRIDESSPMVDARLRDGSRVNAIIPPLALKGPCLTIRKFSEKKLTSRDLLRFNSADQPMVDFLKTCVVQRRNIVVSGGTGSGKTTLLNILSDFIPSDERVVTVEDSAELKLGQPHVVTLEARPANMEGRGAVTIRDLVKNCLRMRPDRIVVGECRGGEALDMLQAMNTGHDGSLTTAHANTPRDMLRRLEIMVLMAGMDLPIQAIREQVSSAVNLVVQQTRFADGSRRITNISEVTGMEAGTIQLNEIFKFQQQGFDADGQVRGRFEATGRVPEFYEELQQRGVAVDMSIFKVANG